MPNHSWLTDQGAQIVRLPNVLENSSHHLLRTSKSLHDLDTIQELPHGYGFGSVIAMERTKRDT
jgi:hypothetical protein